jgi:DNA-binding winged helix-turn-helix (wHTH) protein
MSEPQPESLAAASSRNRVFRFGPFELAPALDELRQNGTKLPIHGQPLQVLELLVRAAGEVVTREALRHSLWADGTIVEFDDVLNNCISRLRQALGDPAGNPIYIETIPRRGYRFLSEVIPVADREEATAQPSASAAVELVRAPPANETVRSGQSRSAKRNKLLIGLVGATILLAALVHVGLRSRVRPSLPDIEQVTFREGSILGARFTPEGRFVVSAAWDGQPEEVFSSAPGDVQLRALGLRDVRLLGVSRTGELAVMTRPDALTQVGRGTLARVSGNGGTPRELAEDVVVADWSPTGELVVVRVVGGVYRIERPLGTTVYEVPGPFFGGLRVSPDGSHVAFASYEDGVAKVRVLDSHNEARVLTRSYSEIEGVAWSPDGTEVWFTADDGSSRGDTLRAVPLKGPEREVYRSTGDLKLEDISADGTILFAIHEWRSDISLDGSPGAPRRSLSWFGLGTRLAALSDDGQLIVFSDHRFVPSTEYVLTRRTDGSPPRFLGEGHALDLSADQRTVLALTSAGLVAIPVGPGAPQPLPTPGLEVDEGRFFRNGKAVVIGARPKGGRERRAYVLEGGSGLPRLISEVGLSRWPSVVVSPDERWVAAADSQDLPIVFPLGGGEPIRFSDILPEPNAFPMGWSAAGDLWVLSRRGRQVLLRVDLRARQVRESRELSLEDMTGISMIWSARVTPDGNAVAFNYGRNRSRLFLMRGAGVPRN